MRNTDGVIAMTTRTKAVKAVALSLLWAGGATAFCWCGPAAAQDLVSVSEYEAKARPLERGCVAVMLLSVALSVIFWNIGEEVGGYVSRRWPMLGAACGINGALFLLMAIGDINAGSPVGPTLTFFSCSALALNGLVVAGRLGLRYVMERRRRGALVGE